MAAIHDLINQIQDPALRAKIEQEVEKLTKQKKFGLVFEEHLPECTLLYDIPVRKGLKVSVRDGKANETYTVLKVTDGRAVCLPKDGAEAVEFDVADLVTTAELGDPIYPCLQPLGEVCNAPDSELWHTLIEADNYHALQLLEYLYAGKVDCIYIDPPYNTGAKDWKYNNDYVDGADEYRHSKWLSFMKKRLEIAKRLLNPNDSVLIVTIDEKEYTFGSTGTLNINRLPVHHVEASDITDDKRIKIVFFKENLSTGWDCPRAETMMSFRVAEDATYIAQLLGRIVRTPLQCHINVDDYLNDVRLVHDFFTASEGDLDRQLRAADATRKSKNSKKKNAAMRRRSGK